MHKNTTNIVRPACMHSAKLLRFDKFFHRFLGVITNSHLQQIIAPEGSSISTTAGGQKVITTPDGKQMIVKVAANGQQMVVGTIEAASPGNANSSPQTSPQPLLNCQVRYDNVYLHFSF